MLACLLLTASALVTDNPPDRFPAPLVTHVTCLELNHVQCPQTGRHVFSQLVLWGWDKQRKTHHVVAWRMVDQARPALIRREGREWVDRTRDGPHVREARAIWFHESWTFHDVELDDRERLPQDQRRGLTRPLEIMP